MREPDTARQRLSALLRTFVVAVLGMWVIGTTLPGLTSIWDTHDVSWGPHGALGFDTDYDGAVKSVELGSPAARAGIVPGDHIDLARTTADDRYFVSGSSAPMSAARKVKLYVIGSSGERPVTLVAPNRDYDFAAKFNLAARAVAALIFVIVGGLLVLLRPSTMTWGFYLYCLGFSPGIAFASLSRHPSFLPFVVNVLIGDLLTAAGAVGIFIFALYFMRDNPTNLRRVAERLVPYLLILSATLVLYPDVANLLLGARAERMQEIMLTFQGGILGLSILITLDTYVRAKPQDRQRIQFVVLALIVGILGNFGGALLLFSSVLPFTPPHWLAGLLFLLNITLPLTVAYAVIRHRVLDLSFVISRAIIYGLITFMLGLTFALISWLLGTQLAATNLARAVEIVAAIALSFWLNSLQAKVSLFIDGIFFRQRRAAMVRLNRAAAALPHAQALATVDNFLVREPVAALDLDSAALFRRDADGCFRKAEAIGWPQHAIGLEHDDSLVLDLEARQEPVRPSEIAWQHPEVEGIACPVLVVPLLLRRQLVGFVFYGAHRNGADIDPEELRALKELAVSAEASYDHLRAEALDREVAELKAQVAETEQLRHELASLQQVSH